MKKDNIWHLYGINLAKLAIVRIFAVFATIQPSVFAEPAPELALASIYQQTEEKNLDQYWVSEKLDGVRAYWDGKQLISRQGNRYATPEWFTQGFPEQPLDGELWIGRENFEQLVSTVRKTKPIDAEWRKVKYMVFDLPASDNTFTDRLTELDQLLKTTKNPYIQLVEQYRLPDHESLMKKLKATTSAGGEGLMLHRGDAYYRSGRTDDLLKVKTHQDAEAIVIAHLSGKGKYKNVLGAILVEMPDGKRFKIGTGFKDKDRKNPPPVGSLITYKFFGLTKKGIPRFASFLRIRSDKN